MRGHYDEAYEIRFGADSGEGDMDDGEERWFEDGTGEDDFIEDGDYEYCLLMEAEYNARKLIPYFDSENACSESAKDFWWCFETATECFDDETRLRTFKARMSGSVGERWCLSSRLTDLETLKRRFYNRFIRLTKEQLLQRLLNAAQERDELVDDWGRRISRYCDEAKLFEDTLRYKAFVNGLRSDRVRRFLDWLPEHSIEVACDWIVAKEFHRPEREGCGAERRARRCVPEVSQNSVMTGGSSIHGENESRTDSKSARAAKGTVPPPRETQSKKKARTVGESKTVGVDAETKKAVERVAVQEEVAESEVRDEPRTESKWAKAAKGTVPPPRETKSKKKARTVGESMTVGAGAETKKAVERGDVEEEVVKNEVRYEPRTEESVVLEKETVVTEETVNKVVVAVEPETVNKVVVAVEPAAVVNEAVQEEKARETPNEVPAWNGTDEPSGVKSMGISMEEEKPKEYQRLFTDEELDAMEASSPRTEESAVPVAVAVAPGEAVNKVAVEVEQAVVATDTTREEKAEEPVCETPVQNGTVCETPVQNGTEEPSGVERMRVLTEEEKTKGYRRLFTDEGLDAMEASSPGQEGTVLAGQEIAVEKEEYDKNLEDRSFPLYAVELQRRVKKNAEAQKEPYVEDTAKHLDLLVGVLERMEEASPDGMSSPEYWQEWFQNTLESSEEAKRANRDSKAVGTGAIQGVPGAAGVVHEDFELSKRRNNADEDQQERNNKAAALVTDDDEPASISVPLDCVGDAALSVSPGTTDEEIDPSVVRTIARVTVYEMQKDYKNGEFVTEGLVERMPDLEEAIKNGVATETVKTMSEERLDRAAEIAEAPKPEIPPDKGMEADFSDWALILATGCVVAYRLLSGYDLVETVRLGWFGLASVLVTANYYAGTVKDLPSKGEFEVGWWPALWSSVVVLTGLTSHRELWKEVRAVGESNEKSRRGRRVSVGEDVPSGNGPYRSARV